MTAIQQAVRGAGARRGASLLPARARHQLQGLGFVLPCVLTLVAVLGVPIALSALASVSVRSPGGTARGLDHYQRLLADGQFWHSLRVSLTFVGATVGLHLVVGLAVALALNAQIRARRFLRVLAILPWTVPDVISGLMWRFMYNPTLGIINHTLRSLGLASGPIDWLGSASLALPSVIQADLWRGYPFVMLILLAGLQAIPKDLYEAARVDGASALREFRHITLPSLRPMILLAIALDVIWQFRRFGLVYNMTAGGPGNATEILSLHIYKQYFKFFEFEYASAMAVAMAVVMLAISIPYVVTMTRRRS